MKRPKLLQKTAGVLIGLCCYHATQAQVHIEGTVYDRTQRFPMRGVSVMGTSGAGTATDSLGHYSIRLQPADSLYFSYLGKISGKIPVKYIDNTAPFDMSLDAPVDTLTTVFVGPRSYREDSLENRREYQKLFNYDAMGFLEDKKATGNSAFGLGIDMDIFWNGKRNKRMDNFREFLEQEEKDKYIDHRFTKALVRKITGLQPPALDSFMRAYRPSYDFIQSFETDMEYYQYIKDASRSFGEMWKLDHPDQVADSAGHPVHTTSP
jgi:hypothetical protein